MRRVTAIDSRIGAAAMAAVSGKAEYKEHTSHIEDSVFYGNSANPDCPVPGTQCQFVPRSGVTTSIQSKVHNPLGLEMHPKKEMHCPLSEQVENGSWAGKAYFKNLKFYDFKPGIDSSGKPVKVTMIKLLPKSPDFITLQHFENLEFHNCDPEAQTFFFEPPTSWANLNDCGDFPCTGPKNTIFSFKNIKWTGTGADSKYALENYTMIPHVKGYTESFPNCELMDKDTVNGHQCTNNDLGILVWESQDPDSIDRSI
jgi:hypothetical protein